MHTGLNRQVHHLQMSAVLLGLKCPFSKAKEVDMKRNVGHPLDKTLRIVIGVALFSLLVLAKGNLRWLGLIGIVPILTVLFGWCPGWAVLGINTAKKE
jgi:hypothetical protein